MDHARQAQLREQAEDLGAGSAAAEATEPDERTTPADESILMKDKISKSYQHVVKQDMKFLESMHSYRTTVRHLNLKAHQEIYKELKQQQATYTTPSAASKDRAKTSRLNR